MQQLLFTNIGNRNLSFNGKTFDKLNISQNFLDFTKKIYEDILIGNSPYNISINILSSILNLKKFDKIAIIATHSGHHQDTFYEALILKHILINEYQYKQEQIQIFELLKPITETAYLLNYYRNKFTQYLNNWYVSLCDAGGSPQQKTLMKIAAEFVFRDYQYEVLYVSQVDGTVTKSNQVEYRNVLQTSSVNQLIKFGQYKGALVLRGNEKILLLNEITKNKVDRLLMLGHFAIHNNWHHKLLKFYKGDAKFFGNHSFLEKPLTKHSRIRNKEFLQAFASGDDAFKCGEFFYLSWYFYTNKEYNNSILNFSRFYELMFQSFIQKKTGFNFHENETEYKVWIQQHLPHLFEQYNGGVVFSSAVCLELFNPQNVINIYINKLKTHFTRIDFTFDENGNKIFIPDPDASKRINNIRNRIAHEGMLVDEIKMTNDLAYFPKLLKDTLEMLEIDNYDFFGMLNEAIAFEIKSSTI